MRLSVAQFQDGTGGMVAPVSGTAPKSNQREKGTPAALNPTAIVN